MCIRDSYYIFHVSGTSRFTAAIVAFTLNYAAYFAEIYRAGIESIPVGQYEAAGALGFTCLLYTSSNEAGLGSSGMVYAAADDAKPVEQGMWGIFEVFVDTIVVCTVTAFAILSSGALDAGKTGAALTVAAFETILGPVGSFFISISIVLFALASMLGWAYYGERGFCKLVGENNAILYRIIFVACAVAGSAARLELVWNLSEIFNGLMALPNLYAIMVLSPIVVQETNHWLSLIHI